MCCKRNIIILFFCLFTQFLWSQGDVSKMFMFGHSLLDHRPPAIPTPSNETTVPHWMFLIAEEAGFDFACGGQYGFLPQHRNLPPISQWGYDIVPPVWESDSEPFSQADIDAVMITAGNFMQWQAPNLDYPGDPGITPISATEDIVDWVDAQENDVRFYIYENWPDMAPYLNGGFPASASEFASYNDYTIGDFNDWWLAYHDALLLSRPEFRVRMIPVGPIISKIHIELIPNQIALNELYEDDAPHGRASTYFLAGLINYMAVYQEKAPSSYDVPQIIHEVIRDNYQIIVDFIWLELINFNDQNGVSRVFFDDINPVADIGTHQGSLDIYPNPTQDFINLALDGRDFEIQILDSSGKLCRELKAQSGLVRLEISNLPEGQYLVSIKNIEMNTVRVQRVFKKE